MAAIASTARPAVRPRLVALTALFVLVAVVPTAPAAAQDAYPPQPEVAVSTPGATIVIHGTDWGPGTVVEIDYGAPALSTAASATVDPDGRFAAEVPVPADAPPGDLPLVVTGTGSDGAPRQWEARALVLAEESPATADTGDADGQVAAGTPAEVTPAAGLPATGEPLTLPLVVASLLLALGAGLVHAARVRTRR